MPAYDLQARLTEWAVDEARKQAFTDQVGVAVTMRVQPVPLPGGAVSNQVEWIVLLTLPSGLVGKGPHVTSVRLGQAEPPEKVVRTAVAAGIEQLRQFRQLTRNVSNGHKPPMPLAPGSAPQGPAGGLG